MADSETSWPNVLTPLPGQDWEDGDMAVFDAATNTFRPVAPGGGAPTPDTFYSLQANSSSPFAINEAGTVQFIGTSPIAGQSIVSAVIPMFAYPATTDVLATAGLLIQNAPLDISGDPGGLDVSLTVVISDLDGTNTMILGDFGTIASGTSSLALQSSDDNFAVQDQTGTDLVFAAGQVTTTAGGTYTVQVFLSVGWD